MSLPYDVLAHEELQRLNHARLSPGYTPPPRWRHELDRELQLRVVELVFLDEARAEVAERARQAPAEVTAFLAWFAELRSVGPGQHDRLFAWLESTASLEQFRWFLRQEVAGEAGFDDLVALTQLRMPTRAKLELARNYWDEMGRGDERGMHGPMLAHLDLELALDHRIAPVAEALALGNLLAGLAFNRMYAYHSVGALGAVELTAPDRARLVNAGLRRLGIAADIRRYYALHATLDLKHSESWNREVIGPLVAAEPACRFAIAEGALMRLLAGQRCFERYRRELGVA